jgi:peptidoglycan hydrolase-like protein with peptidoglycan-binding domain
MQTQFPPLSQRSVPGWRKPALGLAAVMIAGTTAFATASAAGAATMTTATPASHITLTAVHKAAAPLSWPVVARGATGERVFAIQYLLNQRINAHLAVDGKFGPATEAAVRTFQKKSGLTVDGKVGPETWTHLIVTVKSGDTGSAVAALQHNLRAAYGYTSLAVDGIFGAKTAAAVRDFQSRFQLTVDGVAGPLTWNALVLHEH